MLKHGHSRRGRRTRLYRIWRDAVTRCHDPNHQQFKDYGGRGITVCEAWRSSFEAFRDDVLAEIGASPVGALFGRIDTNSDYKPGNIRWASRSEQNRKRRTVQGWPQMAAEIREVYKPERARRTGIAAQALADEFGVSIHVIRDIARGKTWKKPARERTRN